MATLTCAALTAIYYSAESVYADGQRKSDYVTEVNAAIAITENTTATIKLIDGAGKPRTARVYWNQKAAATITDCTADPIDLCDLDGEEANASCIDYSVTGCLSASFTVDEKAYEGSNLNFNDVIADNMLLTMKDLDEAVAQFIIAKVDSFSSANLFHGGVGCASIITPTPNWGLTNIDPAYWTPNLMAYFLQVARFNKFDNAFLLDGDNLYTQFFNAMAESGNSDGSGNKTKMMKMKYYEDMVNMAIVNPSVRKTYMINKGAVAFTSYALWDKFSMTSPKEHGAGKLKFSVKSKNIPGLIYDVYTETVCSSEYEKHTFTFKANLDVFNGPTGRTGGTGVLEFACASCPTS